MKIKNNKVVKKIFNLTIDDEMSSIIKSLQDDMNINVSSLIRRLLKEYYENNKK